MPADPQKPTTAWKLRNALKPPFTLDLVWLVVPFALALICFGLLPLRSWDYWWHITMGRLIHYWGAVPAANHFLYTMEADAPSFVQPWLSQWALFWLHDTGGLQLALLARNLLAAVVFGWVGLWTMKRSGSAMRGAVLTLVGFLIAFQLIAARTHMFVWPLFVLLVWLGTRVRTRRAPLWLLVLFPAAAALWANLHGSFFVVGAIALAFGAAAGLDRYTGAHEFSATRVFAWTATFAASLAAPLINPRGSEIYGYVFDLMTNAEIQSTVTEWMPTTFTNPAGIGIVFYLVLAAGAFLFWRARDELDAADVLLFAGFAIVAAFSARGLMWFGLAAPITLAPYLSLDEAGRQDARQDTPPMVLRVVNLLIALALLAAGILLQPGTTWHRDIVTTYQPIPVRTRAPLAGLVTAETPVAHTELLRKYRKGLHIFHDQKYAGFLTFHLTDANPQQLVFVDQRIELPPQDVWRLYETVIDTPAWRGVFQQFEIDAAVLSLERQAPLVERIRASDDWANVYEDEHNILFVRRD
ncbi:hypothetical protein FIV42_25545 [Persicimonas caeni]|uniref:Glycosyltransferase RgtA/B/C/D-like domain-containing protein n=1 Tax=Persicimonas caeni TaxID=2292766 RepID=A0A4Y6Q091_PERCE|nr:hypothetical protein [Persicimonas caeni]QDG53984.1 hypothetical protein FIV42_25545 [Persicimonas caeni]QED35205.1 hypothetical protein FRD00_25540 [Persicimonas caeni]